MRHSCSISLSGRITFTLMICLIGLDYSYAQGSNPVADEYIKVAESHRRSARPDSAVVYYEKAAIEFESANQIEQAVNAYNQVGIVLTRKDEYELAQIYLSKALQLGKSSLDSINANVATTYISLGVVFNAMEQYEQALLHHNKALAIRLTLYGEEHADVATSYGNLGNVYLYDNQFQQSIEAHTTAMLIREALFGLTSPEIVESYRGLGNVYRETKEYEKSLGYFEKALQNKILQYGPDAKEVSRFYMYVSEAHYLLKDTAKGDQFKVKADAVKNK